jgi:hypothetical protein
MPEVGPDSQVSAGSRSGRSRRRGSGLANRTAELATTPISMIHSAAHAEVSGQHPSQQVAERNRPVADDLVYGYLS